ncbi:DUF1223 domain-containing protein [Oceaniglobus indicus]|uniref:DUF1223 domain-containing protein n=1 Tax=Oceaniglobus indicus TaxID=2047749 RepID=UPI001F4E74A7|nr:DUF1223 domain-containing protein [Oceaniglobus indicus]
MAAALAGVGALCGFGTPVPAGENPVLVELYTSQGCSSCPPADELLTRLAGRDDVIALALHVDYWDYIGWKDIFGQKAHTARQKGYVRAAQGRTIYTPQLIVGGQDHVVGYRPMEVADLLMAHKARPDAVHLALHRENGKVVITAEMASAEPGEMWVQVAVFIPRETVHIERGENAGKTVVYSNIVRSLDKVGDWDGTAPLSIAVDAPADAPLAVIIQRADYGPVLAAARLN